MPAVKKRAAFGRIQGHAVAVIRVCVSRSSAPRPCFARKRGTESVGRHHRSRHGNAEEWCGDCVTVDPARGFAPREGPRSRERMGCRSPPDRFKGAGSGFIRIIFNVSHRSRVGTTKSAATTSTTVSEIVIFHKASWRETAGGSDTLLKTHALQICN